VIPILGYDLPYFFSNLLVMILFYYGLGYHHRIKMMLRIPVYEYNSSMHDVITKEAVKISKEMKETIKQESRKLKQSDLQNSNRLEPRMARRSTLSKQVLECFKLNEDGTIQEVEGRAKSLLIRQKNSYIKSKTHKFTEQSSSNSLSEKFVDFEEQSESLPADRAYHESFLKYDSSLK
jgi:hypothetical protein